MSLEIDVNTAEFRQALAAVLQHAAKPDEDVDDIAGIRLTCTDREVLLQATNRYTAAIASASVWESSGLTGDINTDSIQLPVKPASEILTLFKPAKTVADEMGSVLRITVEPTGTILPPADLPALEHVEPVDVFEQALGAIRDNTDTADEKRDHAADYEPESPATVTFTDVSGLWPGKTYSIPAAPASRALAVLPRLFERGLESGKQVVPGRLNLAGRLLTLFSRAAAAYDGRLTIEPTGRSNALLITIGKQFLGLLMPMTIEPESEESVELKDAHAAWSATIATL